MSPSRSSYRRQLSYGSRMITGLAHIWPVIEMPLCGKMPMLTGGLYVYDNPGVVNGAYEVNSIRLGSG
jgi:hypothetical protein